VTASARPATLDDLGVLHALYRGLQAEMSNLSDLWHLTDGLAEPVADSLRSAILDDASEVIIGLYGGHPFGFLLARVESVHPQGDGLCIGAIRLVYVEDGGREVGIGEAMRDLALTRLRSRGIRRFDAHVLPGHRLAKNFFEQGGFSARHIVMHHDDG